MNTLGQVGAYNQALAAVGVNKFVQAVNEGSVQANTLNIFWQSCQEQVLEDFPWGFASRSVQLALLPDTAPEYNYLYRYPSDCIRARKLTPTPLPDSSGFLVAGYSSIGSDIWGCVDRDYPFALYANESAGGISIATNLPNATLIYTARLLNTALWSSSAMNALVYLLASKIVAPLAADPKYATTAGAAYESALSKAGSNTMNEGKDKRDRESEFITVRD